MEASKKRVLAEKKARLAAEAKSSSENAREVNTLAIDSASDSTKVVQDAIKKKREFLKQYKDLPLSFRHLFDQKGGYDMVVGNLEVDIAKLGAERRSTWPIKLQLDSAEKHEAVIAKQLESAKCKAESLQKEHAEFGKRVVEHDVQFRTLRDKHEVADAETEIRSLKAQTSGTVAPTSTPFVPGTKS